MRTLGIDMASQDASTAACLLEWHDDRIEVRLDRLGIGDDLIVELTAEADVVGIDCPFGWPDRFVQRVAAHHASAQLPDAPDPVDLRLRATDHWTWGHVGRPPLSVSTDKLGIVALRWIGLMARIGGPTADRTGADGLVETYPGGSLTCWGIDHRGYKRGPDAAVRRVEIADALAHGLGVAVDIPTATDDQLDAFLCALTARAHALGLTHPIPAERLGPAAREGWIRLPVDGSLAALVPGPAPAQT